MKDFNREEVQYVSYVCEALFMIIDDSRMARWIGSTHVNSFLILELSELLWDRDIDGTDIYDYLTEFDDFESVWDDSPY